MHFPLRACYSVQTLPCEACWHRFVGLGNDWSCHVTRVLYPAALMVPNLRICQKTMQTDNILLVHSGVAPFLIYLNLSFKFKFNHSGFRWSFHCSAHEAWTVIEGRSAPHSNKARAAEKSFVLNNLWISCFSHLLLLLQLLLLDCPIRILIPSLKFIELLCAGRSTHQHLGRCLCCFYAGARRPAKGSAYLCCK